MLDVINGIIAGTALVLSLVAMFYVRHKNERTYPELMHADNYFEEFAPDETEAYP